MKIEENDYYITLQSVMNFCRTQKVKYKNRTGTVEGVSVYNRKITVAFNDGLKELSPRDLEIVDDRYFKHWTIAEMNFVRENHLLMTAGQMAEKLGRTEDAIKNFKRVNGINKVA